MVHSYPHLGYATAPEHHLRDLPSACHRPVRPHGKLSVIPHDSAILWLEGRLRGRLSPARRRSAEEALKDLRVSRTFHRAQERRRAQLSARGRYAHTRSQELEVA